MAWTSLMMEAQDGDFVEVEYRDITNIGATGEFVASVWDGIHNNLSRRLCDLCSVGTAR